MLVNNGDSLKKSLRKETREILFRDFLDKNLTSQEKKKLIQSIDFKKILASQNLIDGLIQIIIAIKEITIHSLSSQTSLFKTILKIDKYIKLNNFYFFNVISSTKTLQLEYTYPKKLTVNEKKKSSIKVNDSFLKLAINNKNDEKLRLGIINYFSINNQDLIFQKFIQKKALISFIFYSTNYPNIQSSLSNFWDIIITPYLVKNDT